MAKYTKLKSTIDFVNYLSEYEGVLNPLQTSNKGTWMYPKVFIDFAMWVSLEFKSKVIDYVLDGLITSRHNAGDFYKEMCSVILDKHIEIKGCKPNPMLYITEANMIKDIANVNNRNLATEKELNMITTLQKINSTLISKNIGRESRRKQLMTVYESLK
jgi:hypothetical protein